jgi:LPXTG-motif cell wall-anchored protein
MKSYLSYTAIIEAITGIGLIFLPVQLLSLIFGSPLTGDNAIMAAMVAGIAILSLASLCWFLRKNENASAVVGVLFFYNLVISIILLYGFISHGLKGPTLWIVIIFHFLQSIIALVLMNRMKAGANKRK